MKRARAAFALGALLFAWSATALACPACATRSSGGYMIPLLLGAMILTPYLVATVVVRVVKRAEAERLREEQASGGNDPQAFAPEAPSKA